jgi:hypothetical protein
VTICILSLSSFTQKAALLLTHSPLVSVRILLQDLLQNLLQQLSRTCYNNYQGFIVIIIKDLLQKLIIYLSRTLSRKLWQRLYPNFSELFVFSNGWFQGFRKRHCIVRRRIKKATTKLPDELVGTVNEFIQFIRRNSRRESSFSATFLQSSPSKPCSLRRFPTRLIINLDETPLPFEFLEGYTYNIRGTKTIAGKSKRNGWGKRQATTILYIITNGNTPFKPGYPIFRTDRYLKRITL